ncbi:hypothetical protein [Reinekea sp.]|uniref:hypothetical protein n=1 Tax=Reinekea sp. TaxID=1970455 RepID=UPI00398A0C81
MAVTAIVQGKHELFDDTGSNRTPIDVLLEVLNGQMIPILDGFDSCHTHPMLVTPLGVQCTIDFDEGNIKLVSPWLTP